METTINLTLQMKNNEYAELTRLAMEVGFDSLEACFEDQIEKTKLALRVKNGVSGYQLLSNEQRQAFERQFEPGDNDEPLVDLRDKEGRLGD